MQLVHGAQFLNITFLLLLFAAAPPAAAASLTVIFPLASIYESLWSQKLHFSIDILNFIFLLGEYVPSDSSFISTQFLVLNLDG